MTYKFQEGDRVRLVADFQKVGEVEICVPGDGITEWYFVRWDDGSTDRYMRDELETEWN